MATLVPTITPIGEHAYLFVWGPLVAANPDGHPIPGRYVDFSDRSVHISGTFNTGTVIWEGGNDGSTYLPITDPQGTAISKTAAALEQATEVTLLARPRMTGAGTDSITVSVLARRGRGGKEI